MDRRKFIGTGAVLGTGALLSSSLNAADISSEAPLSVGVIGLDTSHAVAFTKIINVPEAGAEPSGLRVTHAYPHGSRDIESSVSRIPRYTEEIKELGVVIVDSLTALLDEVDVVLLETNDGRRHLEQAEAVFEAGKRVFIDKPLAADLEDAIKIAKLAQTHKVPFFTASALRFSPSTVAVKNGSIGRVLGADTYSPATLEPTHTDLYWYGIHGVEALFTMMGPGCKTVRRVYHPDTDLVIGEWEDGRVGTFRGLRSGKTDYGGRAFGSEGIAEAGGYEGYQHLVMEIMEFFRTGTPPVDINDSLELFAFMTAAEISKEKGGEAVALKEVWERPR